MADERTRDPDAVQVKAAGGVLWRPAGDTVEVAVVHRPKYDDWSLPKGKLDPGEDWEEAAVREVEEEVGVRARLGEELSPVFYRDNRDREKAVRYWLMAPERDDGFTPDNEVDEVRWVPLDEADRVLSYPIDRGVVREARERLGS